jgi:integrase
MYVARHSWASIAQAMNVPINVISQGMGHTTEKTTLIYLKSLLNKGLDKANANIIDAVIHPQEDD